MSKEYYDSQSRAVVKKTGRFAERDGVTLVEVAPRPEDGFASTYFVEERFLLEVKGKGMQEGKTLLQEEEN